MPDTKLKPSYQHIQLLCVLELCVKAAEVLIVTFRDKALVNIAWVQNYLITFYNVLKFFQSI